MIACTTLQGRQHTGDVRMVNGSKIDASMG
jgi:hypothetical protein